MKTLLFNIMFLASILSTIDLNSQTHQSIDLVEGEYLAKDKNSSIGISFDSKKTGNYPFDGRKLIFNNQDGNGLMSLNYDMNLLHQKNGTIWITNESNEIAGANYGVTSWAYGESRNVAGWFLSPIDEKGSTALQVNGDATISGSLYFPSDRSLKKDIKEITSVIDKLMALSPKSYSYRQDYKKQSSLKNILPTSTQIGLIAQDVASIYPHLVTTKYTASTDHNEAFDTQESYQAVNYVGMIPILIKAIQEQQVMLEESLIKINSLEQKLASTGPHIDGASTKIESKPIAKTQIITAYPNPTRDRLNIEYNLPNTANDAQLELIDHNGKRVYIAALPNGYKSSVTLDLEMLPAGLYYYYIVTEDEKTKPNKLVIQH